MDEKPESIWKKSWKGPQWLLAWLVLLAASFSIFMLVVFFIPHPQNLKYSLGTMALGSIGSLITATVCVGLWALVRWLCHWRNFKRFLFAAACLITLIVLAYAEEDWRGKNAWENYQRAWKAKGEKFTFADLVPPPVPDDENFAMAPIWVESMKAVLGPRNSVQWFGNNYAEDGRTNFKDRLEMSVSRNDDRNEPANGGSWAKGTFTDLMEWQAYYRAPDHKNGNSNSTNEFPVAPEPQTPAQDVLLALSKYDSVIEELRQAASRPDSRFPIDYNFDDPGAILLPHLAVLKRCSQVLRLRAIAELQEGQSDKAMGDILLMLRLTDACRGEPFLISHLVRLAMIQITLQPIYEGLANHKWSDAQLAELESALSKLDFLADYEYVMQGERALAAGDIDYMRRTGDDSILNRDQQPPDYVNLLIPASFFYRNELAVAEMHQQWTLPMVNLDTRTVSPTLIKKIQTEATRSLRHYYWPYKIFAFSLFPVFEGAVEKFSYGQSSMDLARVAVALECYRLQQGQYPDSLDALEPTFMGQVPQDVIDGGPLHYRRTPDGQFVLYSIGWNERDDGGVVGLTDTKPPHVNINRGDWVWQYPKK